MPGAAQVLSEDIFGGRWGLSVFADINFGFVPGANIGMVDVLLWTAEFGRLVHPRKIVPPPEPDPCRARPLSKKEGAPVMLFLGVVMHVVRLPLFFGEEVRG